MQDTLIPLGALLFIILLAFAMVHTSRKQRAAKQQVFRDFATRKGWHYREEDDGAAQRFAGEFDGIGRFRSSSRGAVIPKDVVTGSSNGSAATLFRHSIRYSEGWAREWFVAGITATRPVAEHCSVQFCKRRAQKRAMHLPDPVVSEVRIGDFDVLVRAPDSAFAGRLVDSDVLRRLADFAKELSFRPEIQIRGRRIVAYLADRNATVDRVSTLEALYEFTRNVAMAVRTLQHA